MASQFRTTKRWTTKRVSPGYTNQLDLFSEAPLETSAPVTSSPARTGGRITARPRSQQLGFEVWEPLPPFDAAAIEVGTPAPANIDANRDATRAQSPQSEIAAPDERASAAGSIDRSSPTGDRVLDIEPEEKPTRDLRITAAHRIGQGSLHEKARDNIAAIRLLKTLEAENREATGDEKALLARYVGSRFGDWQVCWLGGWTRHRLSYLVMVVKINR